MHDSIPGTGMDSSPIPSRPDRLCYPPGLLLNNQRGLLRGKAAGAWSFI